MPNLNDLFMEMKSLNQTIVNIFEYYAPCDDLSNLEIDYADSDQLFLLDELRNILDDLDKINESISYLKAPIWKKGVLYKKSNGRYALEDYELTSGCSIEYLAMDDQHSKFNNEIREYENIPYWRTGRIEYQNGDYYIVGANLDTLDGVHVRLRRDWS